MKQIPGLLGKIEIEPMFEDTRIKLFGVEDPSSLYIVLPSDKSWTWRSALSTAMLGKAEYIGTEDVSIIMIPFEGGFLFICYDRTFPGRKVLAIFNQEQMEEIVSLLR